MAMMASKGPPEVLSAENEDKSAVEEARRSPADSEPPLECWICEAAKSLGVW